MDFIVKKELKNNIVSNEDLWSYLEGIGEEINKLTQRIKVLEQQQNVK